LGQALTPFGPAAVDDRLAASGLHPAKEAVSAFSSQNMGLESHFHNNTTTL
jgi:hypothetical protein